VLEFIFQEPGELSDLMELIWFLLTISTLLEVLALSAKNETNIKA